jgi:hypothetical protein
MHLLEIFRPAFSDADVFEVLNFSRKFIFAGDFNENHPFWYSGFSNHSGGKLAALFDSKKFEISAPQYPTNYSSAGIGGVLDILIQ